MTDDSLSDEQIFMSKDSGEIIEEPVIEETVDPVEPVAETPQEAPVEAKTEEVVAAVEPTPATPEEPPQTSEAMVPSWRLREINEAKAATEQQNAQLQRQQAELQAQLQQLQQAQQQPQQVPDMYEDPTGYQNYQNNQFQSRDDQITQLQQALQQQSMQNTSYARHGYDKVSTAWNAALEAEKSNPAIAARIANSQNPWDEAVKWHEETQIHQQIGEGGIDGFRQRTRDELMKDPEFRKQVLASLQEEAGGGTVATPSTDVPSLSNATRVSTPDNGDPLVSDAELFNMR